MNQELSFKTSPFLHLRVIFTGIVEWFNANDCVFNTNDSIFIANDYIFSANECFLNANDCVFIVTC
jgi:hypothetical protein